MKPQPSLFDPDDVEELVFHDSVHCHGYYRNMTATLIKESDFVGELVGIAELYRDTPYKRNLAWTVSLPSRDVQFYLDLILAIELRDEPYRPVRFHTGISSTRCIEVHTSQKTLTFRDSSQGREAIAPWEVIIADKVQVSQSKTLTSAWKLLYSALWIAERTKAL